MTERNSTFVTQGDDMEDRTEHDDLAGLYQAWTVIANASDWLKEGTTEDTAQHAEWREAARRWRDDVFHPALARVTSEPSLSSVPQPTIEQVENELRAKGYVFHAFGRSWDAAPDRETRYWINGSTLGTGRGRLSTQPFGWFTLEELRAEKFADGCRG